MAAEKRQEIVETAYRLFRRDGFHATGIDRIIAEARVAKMTMYRHFPSKDALIVAALGWRGENFARDLDGLARDEASAAENVAAIIDWHTQWFARPDFNGCLFQHALAEFGVSGHPVTEAALREKRAMHRRLHAILAPALAERAEHAAAVLFMLIEGATLLAHIGEKQQAIESLRAGAATILTAERLQ